MNRSFFARSGEDSPSQQIWVFAPHNRIVAEKGARDSLDVTEQVGARDQRVVFAVLLRNMDYDAIDIASTSVVIMGRSFSIFGLLLFRPAQFDSACQSFSQC
jgi:hypothetical protein